MSLEQPSQSSNDGFSMDAFLADLAPLVDAKRPVILESVLTQNYAGGVSETYVDARARREVQEEMRQLAAIGIESWLDA